MYTFSFTATFHVATSVNMALFVVGHSIFNRCKFSAGGYMEVTLHFGTQSCISSGISCGPMIPGTDICIFRFSSCACLIAPSRSSRNKSLLSSPANSWKIKSKKILSSALISYCFFSAYWLHVQLSKKISSANTHIIHTLICTRKSRKCSLNAGMSWLKLNNPSMNTFSCAL